MSRPPTGCMAAGGQGAGPGENLPSWMILDQQCRDRYLFAGLQGNKRRADAVGGFWAVSTGGGCKRFVGAVAAFSPRTAHEHPRHGGQSL